MKKTAEKTVRDAERIAQALKEGTEKNLRDMINEAVSKFINQSCEEEADPKEVEDDSYEVEDVDTNVAPETPDVNAEPEEHEAPEEGGEGLEGGEGTEEGGEDADEDEWSEFEDYKIGDNDYDFTGVNGDEILKVYNKLGDDDQIFVRKDDDGKYEVKDEETGAEFVIELNPDSEAGDENAEAPEVGGEEGGEDLDANNGDEDIDIDLDGDDEIELDLGDDFEGGEEFDLGHDDEEEHEHEHELQEENLGYTDSYQKDVFDKKFNMSEPADSKTTNDWDDGAPKGAEKPWAGKGDSKPFGEKKDEIDEAGVARRKGNQTTSANVMNDEHADYIQKGSHNVHKGGKSGTTIDESVRRIIAKAKEIQAENQQYKDSIKGIKQSLYEAAVLNVNLGKLVDILVNETTTRDEKKSILERFNAVKTISEGTALYNTIKGELNESKKSSAPIVEKQFVAAGATNVLNETTIYANNPAMDLMNRMDNLFKKK